MATGEGQQQLCLALLDRSIPLRAVGVIIRSQLKPKKMQGRASE